jgi:hypothetical protein
LQEKGNEMITLDGTNGITNDGGYTGDGVVFADTTPANTLVTTTGGNVGVGTSSPAYKLDVTGQGRATTGFAVSTDGSAFTPSGLNAIPNYGLGYITSTSISAVAGFGGVSFYTNQAERARIDSSGNLLVGTTSAFPQNNSNSCFVTGPTGGYGSSFMQIPAGSPNGYGILGFYAGNVTLGNVSKNGTNSVAYNTSSDYRLKEDVQPMMGALAKVAQLKPVTYKWKVDGSDGEGFIAHELAEVCPHAVTGEKDAVDAEGKPVYQGIDTSFLVATLTAAIQEQQAIITALTARVEALDARLISLEGTQP